MGAIVAVDVDGTMEGRDLRLKWTQANTGVSGSAHLTFSEDGRSFGGHWAAADDPDGPGATDWSGTRAP